MRHDALYSYIYTTHHHIICHTNTIILIICKCIESTPLTNVSSNATQYVDDECDSIPYTTRPGLSTLMSHS